MIRVPQRRVVDEDGSQLGVMPTGEAFRLAQERGLDLVEVAPMAVPPVARLLDYGHFKYEQARRDKEARRHQRSVEFKEIRLTPKIGKGDFDTKVRRAIQFLEDGDRVKVAVQFRGRELSHAYIGRDLLIKFGELIKEHGTVERQPLLEGKSMSIVVASTHKPKPQPQAAEPPAERSNGAPARAPARAGSPDAASPAPAAANGAERADADARPAANGAARADGDAAPAPAPTPAPGAPAAQPAPSTRGGAQRNQSKPVSAKPGA